jgi:hypothetical protein
VHNCVLADFRREVLEVAMKPSRSVILCAAFLAACGGGNDPAPDDAQKTAQAKPSKGKQIFRHDTFGDETFWTDTLRLHEVIRGSVDPTTALAVGLKVDADELPDEVKQGIKDGTVSLTSPDTTVALRAVPLDRRRFVLAGHRQTAGRLGQPRPEPWRDHRAVAGSQCREEDGLQLVGQGHV